MTFDEWYQSTDFAKSEKLRLDDRDTRAGVFRNVWDMAQQAAPAVKVPVYCHSHGAHLHGKTGVGTLGRVTFYCPVCDPEDAPPPQA